MRMTFVNKPEGKGYAQAFAELMKADGLDTMDKTSISAVLWLGDDPERMRVPRCFRLFCLIAHSRLSLVVGPQGRKGELFTCCRSSHASGG